MAEPQFDLCSGNKMIVRGALAAGCNFFSGYPITPSSEIYAEMMKALPSRGGIAVGAPDEISALSYSVGASLSNSRSMTATSGPGWSLMIETFQYALMTETPVVIVVVQRLGPATGGATQGGQGDVLFVEYATSGGFPVPVLAPVDSLDCYRLTAEAFRISETLRTPVVLLSDKEVGTTIENVDLSRLPSIPKIERPKASENQPFLSYQIKNLEDVPPFSPAGGSHKITITGSAHNQAGQLRKNDPETLQQLKHLSSKILAQTPSLENLRWHQNPKAKTLLISFGISARTCRQVFREKAKTQNPIELVEVLSLFPVPIQSLTKAIQGKKQIVVVEENGAGLYAKEIRSSFPHAPISSIHDLGHMITPQQIFNGVSA